MKISIDISYYPLNDQYLQPIKDFIAKLQNDPNIAIKRNTMSTQIFGEYDYVMDKLKTELKEAFTLPHSVFVLKIINADLEN